MEPPLISIIIPTFNRVEVLPAAIESVIKQSRKRWELIIVDDGSSDFTLEGIGDYLQNDRIKYFYQKNQGVSAARNYGIKEASGEYIIFLDSDDEFSPDLIESLENINFWNYDIICWNVLRKRDRKQFVTKPVILGKMYNEIRATFLAGSVCYKKSIINQCRGFDPKISFGENYELGLRVSQIRDLKIKIIDKSLLRYTINTSKRESNSLENRVNSYFHIFHKHRELYEKDLRAKGRINYLLGFVMEKTQKREEALNYYKISWRSYPWRIKPVLKILYLKLVR